VKKWKQKYRAEYGKSFDCITKSYKSDEHAFLFVCFGVIVEHNLPVAFADHFAQLLRRICPDLKISQDRCNMISFIILQCEYLT